MEKYIRPHPRESYELLLRALEEYPPGTKTVKGRVIGNITWNKEMRMIVCDTVNIYNHRTKTWIEKK